MTQNKLIQEVMYEIIPFASNWQTGYPIADIYDEAPSFYDKYRISDIELNMLRSRIYEKYDNLYKLACVLNASTKNNDTCISVLQIFFLMFHSLSQSADQLIMNHYNLPEMEDRLRELFSCGRSESIISQIAGLNGYSAIFVTDYLVKNQKAYKELESSVKEVFQETDETVFEVVMPLIKDVSDAKKKYLEQIKKVENSKVAILKKKYSFDFYNDVLEYFKQMKYMKDIAFCSYQLEPDKAFSGFIWDDMKEKQDSMSFLARKSLKKVLPKYMDLKLGIMAQVLRTRFNERNLKYIINKGFFIANCSSLVEPTDFEKENILKEVFDCFLLECLYRDREKYISEPRVKKEVSQSKSNQNEKRLKEENILLKEKLDASDTDKEKALKELKEKVKLLNEEAHYWEKEAEKLNQKIEELYQEEDGDEEITETVIEEGLDIDAFLNENLQKHKIAVWGLRDKHAKIIKEKHPEFICWDSDKSIQGKEMDGVEGVIIYCGYTCHSKYWTARDQFKARGMKICHIPKEKTNEKYIYEMACGIIMSSENIT